MSGRKLTTGADFQGQRGQNAANGTNPTDLVTLQQLQALMNGLDWHLHCRLAAQSNVNVSNPGTSTFDGTTANNGDRILLPNQTTGSQNNIYIFNGSANAMTLAPDAVQGALDVDSTVSIAEGTVGAGKSYTLITKAPITVGTTALTWAFNNSAVTYTSGYGLLLNASNVFSVDATKIAGKYSVTIGDGSSYSYTVTHNLTTNSNGDVVIGAWLIATGEQVEADVSNRTATGFTMAFGSPPASNSVRVNVIG